MGLIQRRNTSLDLAFRPGTDDMCELAAISVVQELVAGSAKVKALNPLATHEAQKISQDQPMQYCDTLAKTVQDVNVVLLLTRWAEFRALPDLPQGMAIPPLMIGSRCMLDKIFFARCKGIDL